LIEIAVGHAPRGDGTEGKTQPITKHRRSRHRYDLHAKPSMEPQCNPTIGPHAVQSNLYIHFLCAMESSVFHDLFDCVSECALDATGTPWLPGETRLAL